MLVFDLQTNMQFLTWRNILYKLEFQHLAVLSLHRINKPPIKDSFWKGPNKIISELILGRELKLKDTTSFPSTDD